MKQTLSILLMSTALAFGANAVQAQDLKNMSPKERHETLKNMSEEQRKEFKDARKEKWEGMSDAEKVQAIEKRRAEHMKERKAKWDSLSDAEKIKKAEQHMKGKHKGKGERPHRKKED